MCTSAPPYISVSSNQKTRERREQASRQRHFCVHNLCRQRKNLNTLAQVRASGERQVIIAVQFVVSTLVVCSNLYQLAKITLNAQSCPLILYTCTMLAQILIFCWYGNEVKLRVRITRVHTSRARRKERTKRVFQHRARLVERWHLSKFSSVDCVATKSQHLESLVSFNLERSTNIFRIEWLSLDKSSKKSILLMMSRASVPIEFTSVHILTMNLDSFVSVSMTCTYLQVAFVNRLLYLFANAFHKRSSKCVRERFCCSCSGYRTRPTTYCRRCKRRNSVRTQRVISRFPARSDKNSLLVLRLYQRVNK